MALQNRWKDAATACDEGQPRIPDNLNRVQRNPDQSPL